MAVEIRPVRRDELDQGLPLFAGYQRFYGVDQPDDDRNRVFFARFVAPSDDGLLLGAWLDRAMVGFACIYWTFSSVSATEIALMNDLFVAEGARGRGIGRALIDEAAAGARRRGLLHLEWYTAPAQLASTSRDRRRWAQTRAPEWCDRRRSAPISRRPARSS